MSRKHPDQKVYLDDNDVVRFKENNIVSFLLDSHSGGLNSLVNSNFSTADWNQFYQLIGYSICGYCDLRLVSEKAKDRADKKREKSLNETS